MTTINCSSNCRFQKDGMCNLNNFYSLPISSNPECAYFQPLDADLTGNDKAEPELL